MITLLENLPDGLVGFKASGKIDANDYKDIILPAIDNYLVSNQEIRMVYQFDDETATYTLGGMYEDAKVGLAHIKQWHKVAIVTDKKWLEKSAEVMSKVFPAELRSFHSDEFDKAVEWAKS